MLKIAWHPSYKYALPEGHRFPMVKYELLPEQLLYEGTCQKDNFFSPDQMSDDLILLTHTEKYLHNLNNQLLDEKEIRKIGFPMTHALVQRGKHIANGTYLCTQHALKYGVAMNIAGGTHHSYADHGEGFCVFNDIAISANILLTEGLINKILIVDVDVHQGNGTAKIFENEPRVFTFSMHGEKNYPVRKEQSSLDIGLPDKADDLLYLTTLKSVLPRLLDEVKPDFIFYLSGVDIIESDKLGRLSVSKNGCKERDRYCLSLFQMNKIPVAVSMGGGYSPRIADIIDCHANTFRVAQEIFF
jgi:acetoin utilization deacetylase AcuC-like enzyme